MESEEIQSRIDFYLDAFDAIKKKVGDDQTAALLVEQIGKDSRVQAMTARYHSVSSGGEKTVIRGDEPASEAQMGYLKRLGVDVPQGVNKQNASELIDAALVGR